MKYWRIYTSLLCVLLSSSFVRAGSDTLQLQRVADSLANGRQYYAAGIWYQKLAYFAQGSTLRNRAHLAAAACYKLNGNFREGIAHLNNVRLENAPDSLIREVKFQCAIMAYLDSDNTLADSYLEQLGYLVKDSAQIRKTLLLHALVLNELYRWPEAKHKLLLLCHGSEPERMALNRHLLDSLYNDKAWPRLKSADRAALLSTFVPGLGQCYANSYGEGVFSFLAITACAGGAVIGILHQYYFTSIVLGNLLIAKFYQGGVKRAEFLAERYNYKKAKDYNSRLRDQLRLHFVE